LKNGIGEQGNRAMKQETWKEIATRLVVEAEALAARQQQLVMHLDRKGYSTKEAIRLLDQFEAALKTFRRTWAFLQSAH
jgi:hypothetical protein